jgi:hypothetical protein
MKFQTASAIFLAMTSAVDAVVYYDTSIPTPVCEKFNNFRVGGTGEYINTDNSSPVPLPTGKIILFHHKSTKHMKSLHSGHLF